MGEDVEARFGKRMGSRRGFRGVRSPRSRGGERSPHPSPRLCVPATWSPCTWGRGGGGRGPGRRGSKWWAGPRQLPFLRFDWLRGAVEPPLRPFIRSGRGRRKSALHLLSFLASGFLPPSAMEGGNPGPSSVAARVTARQRAPPPLAPVVAEPAVRGRGREQGRGRG